MCANNNEASKRPIQRVTQLMQTNSIPVVYSLHTLTGTLLTSILGSNWWRPLDCFSATSTCLHITKWIIWMISSLAHNSAVHVSMTRNCRTSSYSPSSSYWWRFYLLHLDLHSFIPFWSGLIIRFGRDECSLFSCLFRESKIDSSLWQWQRIWHVSNFERVCLCVSTAFEYNANLNRIHQSLFKSINPAQNCVHLRVHYTCKIYWM